MPAPLEPQPVVQPARRRPEPLSVLIWSLAVLGALSMVSALPDIRGGQVPSLWQMGANWHEFGGAHVVAHACVVSVTVPLSDPV